jgi:hypothetical protein
MVLIKKRHRSSFPRCNAATAPLTLFIIVETAKQEARSKDAACRNKCWMLEWGVNVPKTMTSYDIN